MKSISIFISYNPESELEETLACRLHTMGVVNDFTMYLPDRYDSEIKISRETKFRIKNSDYFILFSMDKLSNVVEEEIKFAFDVFQDKSKILVMFYNTKVENLDGDITNYLTPLYFGTYLNRLSLLSDEIIKVADNEILAALFIVGFGLFVLMIAKSKQAAAAWKKK